MFTIKWNEWVEKYGIANVLFVVGNIESMKLNRLKYGLDFMIESYEDSLNETIN